MALWPCGHPGDEALMQCLVHEAAGRLHECSGQEVLDLIESISTGKPPVGPARWLVGWLVAKLELVFSNR